MQVSSGENERSINCSCSATEYAEMVGTLREDFSQKLEVTEVHRQEGSTQNNYYHKNRLLNEENPRLPPVVKDQEEEEEEFSFVCINPSGPLISAEDAFQNGQIRPIYPFCNSDDLLFAEDVRIEAKASTSNDLLFAEDVRIKAKASTSTPLMFREERSETEGPCCVWSGGQKVSRNQQICKKRNFTRFSKLRRIREFVFRSTSLLSNDAFILFNQKYYSSIHPTIRTTTSKNVLNQEKKKDVLVVKKKERIRKMVSS